MNWFLKDTQIEITTPPEGAFGFLYLIQYHEPETGKVYSYIGKKNFYQERTKALGKKELAARTDRRQSKKKKVVTESDWRKYQSSNDFLKTVESKYLSKEILKICYSKTELSYSETKALFVHEVLEHDNFLNSNISGTYFKTK